MKTHNSFLHVGALAVSVSSLLFAGCSKKETAASSPTAAAPQTASQPVQAPAPQNVPAVQQATDAANRMAAEATARAQKETQAAAARAAEVQKALQTNLAAVTQSAPTVPGADAPAATAPAIAAVATSIQQQAAELLARYSAELDVITKNAAALKKIVDQNLALLPAGVQTKYKEFNALLPELSAMVATLKDYQKVDLAVIVPKLQSDFARAQRLYAEIRGMLPAGLGTP